VALSGSLSYTGSPGKALERKKVITIIPNTEIADINNLRIMCFKNPMQDQMFSRMGEK
jgi:hypothetical protein